MNGRAEEFDITTKKKFEITRRRRAPTTARLGDSLQNSPIRGQRYLMEKE